MTGNIVVCDDGYYSKKVRKRIADIYWFYKSDSDHVSSCRQSLIIIC